MQLVKPSIEIINEPDTLKRIEIAGRVCYKSEDKITEGSAEKFYKSLVKRGHTSVLEHSNLIVYAQTDEARDHLVDIIAEYNRESDIPSYIRNDWRGDNYETFTIDGDELCYTSVFSGNLRAWRALAKRYAGESVFIKLFGRHPWFEDIFSERRFGPLSFDEYEACCYDEWAQAEIIPWAPGDMHNIITCKFICSRGVSHEIVRHRLMSFSQESQRYCNYKDLAIIISHWFGDYSMPNYALNLKNFLDSNLQAEHNYRTYIENGMKPQDARGVLTNDTKTEVVVTGTILGWKRFIELRESPAAHPDIRVLAKMFKESGAVDFPKED